MTRVYDETGRAITVTAVSVEGNRILQRKTIEIDGYEAVQVGYEDQKIHRVPKPMQGHFKKSGSKPKKFVREFRLNKGESIPEGDDLFATLFQIGQFVDVVGRSKGKGFQGVVKRYRHSGQPMTHGSMMHRRTGAIGNRSTPGLVWKNMKMPGHMGSDRITVQNLKIVQVREEDNVILVSGAIPGAKGSYVVIRPAKKKPLPK